MNESNDCPPDIARQLMAVQRQLADGEMDVPEALANCFDVLVDFPRCTLAHELIEAAHMRPGFIWEMRRMLSRLVDEWDDRPWQQRRRWGISFSYLCQWKGRVVYEGALENGRFPSVHALLQEGIHQLQHAYLLGNETGAAFAWDLFGQALAQTTQPDDLRVWAAWTFAKYGYFAEAVELLAEPATVIEPRLWMELRWWRDHIHWLPWVPPDAGTNGQRYIQMAQSSTMDASEEEIGSLALKGLELSDAFAVKRPLSDDIIAQIEVVLTGVADTPLPQESPVDWTYLDKLVSGDFSTADWPAWAQYMLRDVEDTGMQQELLQFLLQYLANPSHDERPFTDDA